MTQVTGFAADFQWKAVDFWVKLMQYDAYLKSLVSGRVSPQHLATISNPIFPLITVTRQGIGGDPTIPNIDHPFIMIDIYSKKDVAETWKIYSNKERISNKPLGVRPLLHGQSFRIPGLVVKLMQEVWVSDGLYQAQDQTFRLSARYKTEILAQTIKVSQ